MTDTSQFAHLTNEELRQELSNNGIPYGPIMSSTRKVYEKKLQNFLAGDSLIMNGNSENGGNEELLNKNGNKSVDKVRTPSRENTPKKNESSNKGSRQVSPSPELAADNDSDNEEEAYESTRLLTPEELQKFRSGFRRYSGSPKANDSNTRKRIKTSLPLQTKVNSAVLNTDNVQGNRATRITKRISMSFFLVFCCLLAAIYYLYLHDQLSFKMLSNFSFGGNVKNGGH